MVRNTVQSPPYNAFNNLKEAIDASSITGIPSSLKKSLSYKPLTKKEDGENVGPLEALSLSSKSHSGNSLTPSSAERKNIMLK